METTVREIEHRITKARAAVITGDDLRRARETARVRPSAIARALGVSRQYVYKVEIADVVAPDTADRYLDGLKAASRK